MLIQTSILLLSLAGWLWWMLTRSRQKNALLHAEIVRLRARLRAHRY
jgi:hypothetical protein